MSDDTGDEIMLVGDPLTPEQVARLIVVSQQVIDDAIDLWDEVADDLFVGVLEWNA